MSTPIERARSVWDALEEDRLESLSGLVSVDVQWRPWGNHGRPLVGVQQIVEWHRAQHAVVHQWESIGECALASGSLRVFRAGGFLDVQPTWVFFFRDERLHRAICLATREEALAAVEAHVVA